MKKILKKRLLFPGFPLLLSRSPFKPDRIRYKLRNGFSRKHCIHNHEARRLIAGIREIIILHLLKYLPPLEMLSLAVWLEPGKCLFYGEDAEECPVGNNRPAVMHGTQPCFRVGNDLLQRDRLVCITAVTVPVGDDQFSFCKSGADHRCKMGCMVCDKEGGFGYRIDLLGNCPADRIPYPRCPGFAGEDRIEIKKQFSQSGMQRALPAPVNAFQRD
jgi:hypothetical protein